MSLPSSTSPNCSRCSTCHQSSPQPQSPHGTPMPATNTTAPQAHRAGLLDQAIGYAVSAVQDLTPGLLRRPTPCQAWDLDTLLRHASESLATLHEAIDTAAISLFPATPA